jgi:uncharacterized protein (TIGR03067 family)
VTAVFLALALAPSAPAPRGAAPSIVGEWAAVPVTEGRHTELPPEGMTVTFTRDGKCLWNEGTGKPDERLYLANPLKAPAEIDISETGPEGERPMRGVYELEGDMLVICLSLDGTRPTKLGPSGDGAVLRITFKRVPAK